LLSPKKVVFLVKNHTKNTYEIVPKFCPKKNININIRGVNKLTIYI